MQVAVRCVAGFVLVAACHHSASTPHEFAPRVWIEAVFYEAEPDARPPMPAGGEVPYYGRLAEAVARVATHVSSVELLCDNDTLSVASAPPRQQATVDPPDEVGAALASYRLAVRPYVLDAGDQLQLDLDIGLGPRSIRTTLTVDDRKTFYIGTPVHAHGRALMMAVRPVTLRTEGELVELRAERRQVLSRRSTSTR